jgi:ABC-2 type transport system ATP-binding protein
MTPPAIRTDALTRRFGATTAVDALSMTIDAGDVFGCLGHNGAGKTTTVRLLNGVLTPNGGAASVLGFDPVTQGPEVRARTGVLTETPSLDDRLTARATLRLYADIFNVPRDQVARRVDELLDLFDLGARADDKVGGFSKGMRQRMALARTLLHDPDILFLDEPTAALDPVATREVHALIRNASEQHGRTVFLCTHNLYEAERLCTRVAVLAQGRLLALGTPADLARQYGRQQRLLVVIDPAHAAQAQAALAALPWPLSVSAGDNGDAGRLHIQGLPRTEAPHAVAALVQAGVAIYEVVRGEATLEDVYFALQEQVAA